MYGNFQRPRQRLGGVRRQEARGRRQEAGGRRKNIFGKNCEKIRFILYDLGF
ncbi:hypothetical protein V0288_06455 [Pannus brasiliensis CCIBt3594]|uniref:Uncharacterized protein n=1 Tax=Pannus brasiliensis CCIBt3594 TaxID=1427578 RepID=A0AAW9QSV2_9CHRO